MHYFGVPKLQSIQSTPIGPKMMFGSVTEHFANLLHVKEDDFGTVLEHFANLHQVKR
jgi:hypothetical protein